MLIRRKTLHMIVGVTLSPAAQIVMGLQTIHSRQILPSTNHPG